MTIQMFLDLSPISVWGNTVSVEVIGRGLGMGGKVRSKLVKEMGSVPMGDVAEEDFIASRWERESSDCLGDIEVEVKEDDDGSPSVPATTSPSASSLLASSRVNFFKPPEETPKLPISYVDDGSLGWINSLI